MPRVRFVPRLLATFALAAPMTAAAVTQQARVPQLPTVSREAFRVDPFSGALVPLEAARAKKEGYGTIYCYLEGAHSSVTVRQGDTLVFAARLEGSPKWLNSLKELTGGLYYIEPLFISDKERRYATKKFVPVKSEAYGEMVMGVNPKKEKEVGQAFMFWPTAQLAPGEYAISVGGVLFGTYPYPDCSKEVWAFRVVEAAPAPQYVPPPPPRVAPPPTSTAPPPQTTATTTTTNSPADIERLRRAADLGDVTAQFALAQAYGMGNGVPQDYAQTGHWLRRAAAQGSSQAQYWLGVMYRDAVGVAPDQALTVQYFRLASEQGHAEAQANLGNLYFFGRGVAQDNVEAHKWLNIAAASLEGNARKQCTDLRDKVAGLMTPEQLAEAQRRATAWFDAFLKRR